MKCPGQDSRYWKPGSIFEAKCPQCGEPIEFFKDDPTRKCVNCGHKMVNPNMDFGCAAYCRFADQCIGELPPELLAEREGLMKDRIAIEMKKYFHKDFKRIGHATRTARHAEAIAGETDGDLAIILAAAYLHGIVCHGAEPGRDSAGKKTANAKEATPIREILEKAGAKEAMIESVCDIISRHGRRAKDDDTNFKVVSDAIRIAEIENRFRGEKHPPEEIKKMIETEFFTESAARRAEELFLHKEKETL